MTISEYLEELQQVPKRLAGTLLEKLLETEEVQAAKKIYEHAEGMREQMKRVIK